MKDSVTSSLSHTLESPSSNDSEVKSPALRGFFLVSMQVMAQRTLSYLKDALLFQILKQMPGSLLRIRGVEHAFKILERYNVSTKHAVVPVGFYRASVGDAECTR